MTPDAIKELVARGALFAVNHSAGKDSQAMLIKVRELVPDSQIVLIHADLGEVEWRGNVEHIRATAGDLPLIIANPVRSFFEMVEKRGMFPSPKYRQCTADLKRNPIERELRRYLRDHPEFNGVIVNCMGLRAQESKDRASKTAFGHNAGNSVVRRVSKAGKVIHPGRLWFDWLPIHDMRLDEVWETIAGAGQKPHWAYGLGMSRLSCVFCIMANKADLRIAAQANPDLYRRYVELEKRVGHTMSMERRGLEEVTGIAA